MSFRRLLIVVIALVFALSFAATVRAAAPDPTQPADQLRAALLRAQVALATDPVAAQAALADGEAQLALLLPGFADPALDQVLRAAFAAAHTAVDTGSGAALAAARADIWTGVLRGSLGATEQALRAADADRARQWLALREFRRSTRVARPGADGTVALQQYAGGTLAADAAWTIVRADLLDTYQAQLTRALDDVVAADAQGFATRRAEHAALAQGYFAILAPEFANQRSPQLLATAAQSFINLRSAALAGADVPAARDAVLVELQGFRAVPLSTSEAGRRTGQLLRYLSLVAVEYGRGVYAGRVTVDLEIREAITFADGANAAFADLRPLIAQRDAARADAIAAQFDRLRIILAAAGQQTSVASAGDVDALTAAIDTAVRAATPAAWQAQNAGADFDVIATTLDQMEAALAAGDYALAESARLEAYAIMEVGPEAKMIAFAPQFKPLLEGLFWYGQEQHKGLAYLIGQRAPVAEILATRRELDVQLHAAEQALGGESSSLSVAGNAAIIVFREGLEAVLILASLLGSLKIGAQRRFRAPLWAGAVLALAATALTWLLARGALTALARYGERLEAVVSIVAVAVLLLITNWFFHNVYWKGWMASFHQQKKKIITGGVGSMLGLVLLGFTSIYREGFETVLFLQALVLEAGNATVLAGTALGLLATFLIGLIVFVVQAKLPHKKMLIVTGIMIGVVLIQMTGNTLHVLQVVGWLPTTPIRWLTPFVPYWMGIWFGVYATWEGIGAQAAAAIFTIGSYFLAERMAKRAQTSALRGAPAQG